MDRQEVKEGLKALEHQIIALMNKIDDAKDKLLRLTGQEFQHRGDLQDLLQVLHYDLMSLQELYQMAIYKTAILTETDGNA